MLHLVNPLTWGSKRAVYCFPKREISHLIEIYEKKENASQIYFMPPKIQRTKYSFIIVHMVFAMA